MVIDRGQTPLGPLARRRDDFDTADARYAAAFELRSGDAPTANNLAEIRRAQGRAGEALALYKRAAALGMVDSEAVLGARPANALAAASTPTVLDDESEIELFDATDDALPHFTSTSRGSKP